MNALKQVLVEAALITGAGAILALLANQVSPRGLALTRDYFPGATRPSLAPSGHSPGTTNAAGTNAAPEELAARIRQRGLQLVDHDKAAALFNDPRHAQGLIVFVDARNDAQYLAGHIPGARQLDYYRPDTYLPEVLPACLNAEVVVVYCTGGACEVSEFAAVMLRDAGVPPERLLIYGGGITEWTSRGLPVQTGARQPPSPPRAP